MRVNWNYSVDIRYTHNILLKMSLQLHMKLSLFMYFYIVRPDAITLGNALNLGAIFQYIAVACNTSVKAIIGPFN